MEDIKLYANLERTIARQDDTEAALGDEAFIITQRARAKLAEHRKTGTHKITQTKGNVDHYVNLVGGDEDDALALEEGHFVAEATFMDYVDGLHILRDSILP
jgi:hypothetical protein